MADLDNPYAAPRSEEMPPPDRPYAALDDATGRQRMTHWVVDGILVRLLLVPVLATGAGSGAEDGGSIARSLVALALIPAYYFLFELIAGRTPAKFLTRTRVVTRQGGPPSAGQIAGRTLARFVPFEAFSFLSGNALRGWHDRWSHTRVIRDDSRAPFVGLPR